MGTLSYKLLCKRQLLLQLNNVSNRKSTSNSMNTHKVLLTNGQIIDKLYAHIHGLQHYAFSVFIFNTQGKLLLQQRAYQKYHSGGLWTNTCCSHPSTVEFPQLKEEAERRLLEEMGISCKLDYYFQFSYNTTCGNLIENEVDFIFVGYSDDTPIINHDEVNSYTWESLPLIKKDIIIHKNRYSKWFYSILKDHSEKITKKIRSDLNIHKFNN